MSYDTYNREERYVCAHLFRLLHEPHNGFEALRRFLGTEQASIDGFRIYAEVALIRDAYHHRRESPEELMDDLVRVVMEQEQATACRLYSELPVELRSPWQTHPRQIRLKAGDDLNPAEEKAMERFRGCSTLSRISWSVWAAIYTSTRPS